MPAGIFTVSFFCCSIWPSPLQVLQGVAMTLPVPRQAPQVRAIVKKPCWNRIWPAPRHWLHVVGCVPGAAPLPLQVPHVSWRGIWIVDSAPLADWANVTSRS